MRYVVHRRFRDKCLSGIVNLPFGTECTLNGEFIEKDGKPLVVVTSENAHQFFARDDDGKGIERGKLTQQVQRLLARNNDATKKAWERIWADQKLLPYKMREFDDHWLWNHAFFNAEIEVLQYIIKVITGGTICTE